MADKTTTGTPREPVLCSTKQIIAETFLQMADGLETGSFGKRPKIAVTGLGSEHGEANVMEAAVLAAKDGTDVIYLGTLKDPAVTTIEVAEEELCHKKMEELLEGQEIDAAVTMYYPFPIGVTTIGRAVTPGRGKELFIASTTGTSATDRTGSMVRNTVAGIIAAKACGNAKPTVGILNVDGARQTEKILKEMIAAGYELELAESARSDGGCVMRGNDVLTGTPDIMVCDSLTGNILMKMLSSYTSGGSYEAAGYGYGPGIGEGSERVVMIISRASGAPVIAGAIRYAAELVKGQVQKVAAAEYARAEKAGMSRLLQQLQQNNKASGAVSAAEAAPAIEAPAKEVVTAQISGIEIMDLEDGVQELWKNGIYAESGMGCTGPIILVNEAKEEAAKELLKKTGYITE